MSTSINSKFLYAVTNDQAPTNHSGHKTGIESLIMLQVGENTLDQLMAFKASERKDDPERRQGLHGPYEALVLQRTGKLPDDYYDVGDDIPWGFRLNESRSNILWQVLSGMLDNHPQFAASYMGLALDQALAIDEYAKELTGLHQHWADYNRRTGIFNQHTHRAMKNQYQAVSCPACSILTALACQDEGMNALFQKLVPLGLEERKHFMVEQGFVSLLNVMIPTQPIHIEHKI